MTAGRSRAGRRIGRSRAGRRMGWPAAAGLALTLAATVTGAAAAPAGAVTRVVSASCGKAVGPFTVHGTQVLGQGGTLFVSYGITVPGLQGPDWPEWVSLDLQKIGATAADWCANTVRLQLSQDNLLGPGGTGFDQAYMTAIESEVALAEQDNLVVVLNDETNFAPLAVRNDQLGPTSATETFWKDLASVYGSDPQVIFDLFNEPRTYSPGMSQAQEWQLWLNGGSFDGVSYLGLAPLASYVRTSVGARNLFWVEGPRYAVSFAGMVRYGALLHVSGVVYSIHHPAGPHDQAAWYADFGNLITDGIAPVVDGEWTNYEPSPTADPTPTPGSCWTNAPTTIPQYLRYLSMLGVGLNAYQLQPGLLIRSYSNLGDPTTINASTWSCQSDSEPQADQGAGSEILTWFEQQNGT